MLEKINGMKTYIAGGLMILTGALQILCDLTKICLLPDALVVGGLDPTTGLPLSGWGLVLAGLTVIGVGHKIDKNTAAVEASK
jgi:hypothetical protein